ncbi:MAG TPA: SMP-30/gluconolactonase/LRE family protein [Burkholderiales bacterium]
MKPDIECLTDAVNDIGEGPVWSARDEALYWIDAGLEPKTLLRYRPGSRRTEVWTLPHRASSLMQRKAGGLVIGFQRGLATMDPVPTGIRTLELHGVDFDHERFNDSAVDRAGRLWIGTFDRTFKNAIGTLYRIDRSLAAEPMARGFMMSNGIAWSPDNRTLYFCDSRPGRIHAYDYDIASGTLSNARVFMEFAGRGGRPDGCTIDSEGFLWVAEIDAGQLLRIGADGKVAQVVALPVSRPTSVAFGGAGLSTLFITSMTYGLTPAQRAAQPFAGRLLALDAGVAGLPEPMLDY